MTLDNKFYHRGKTARREGKPCELSDARIKVSNRTAWFKGWQDQDKSESPVAESDNISDTDWSAFLQEIKDA